MPPKSTPEYFWSRVSVTTSDECWEWRGATARGGYGVLHFQRNRWTAHRLAQTLACGPIPDGKHVCHTCDNPPCCNPDHLFLCTQAENNADMAAKGRAAIYQNPTILTPDQVRSIRHRYRPWDRSVSQRALAREHGVSRSVVSQVIRGEAHKHVS
jgi:hypothetical protein